MFRVQGFVWGHKSGTGGKIPVEVRRSKSGAGKA